MTIRREWAPVGSRRRWPAAAAAALALVAAACDPGSASPREPSVPSPDASGPAGLDAIGHLDLDPGLRYGDLFFYDHGGDVGPFVYLGTSSNFEAEPVCGGGVKIVDVSDPADPALVATASADPDVSSEDVAVARVGERDVLAVGIQACADDAPHGLALFDVTDPSAPEQLSLLETPPGGIHELDLVVRADGRALVLGTVPHSEREGTGGDVRIIEVTDPESPVELADWGIVRDSSLPMVGNDAEIVNQDAGIGAYASNLAHGVRAADEGMTAYVSHWDAGVLKLDISDPANPRLVGRTTFGITDDGDAHSVAIYDRGGTRYLLQNDEEVSPLSPPVISSSATRDREYPGMENQFMPTPLAVIGTTEGEVLDANDACERSDFRGVEGAIVLFDVGDDVGCDLGGQVVRAIRSGASGFLANFVAPYRPTFFRLFPDFRSQRIITRLGQGVPSAMFSELDGGAEAIRRALVAGAVSVTLTPTKPSWGFLRVFTEEDPLERDGVLEYRQVGAFSALLHVVGDPGEGPGTSWTIHNTATMGSRAYSSWYGHGIVALDVSDPTRPALLAQFAPESDPPTQMWGVSLDRGRGLVFGSDMVAGLWVLRPTGAAA